MQHQKGCIQDIHCNCSNLLSTVYVCKKLDVRTVYADGGICILQACEFHGVVRFYFQDGTNVVTKCIRVASTATAREVVDVLVEKFRPDMRMLTANKYALYEVHANGGI